MVKIKCLCGNMLTDETLETRKKPAIDVIQQRGF